MKPRLPKGRLPNMEGMTPMVRCEVDRQLSQQRLWSANESRKGVAEGSLLL